VCAFRITGALLLASMSIASDVPPVVDVAPVADVSGSGMTNDEPPLISKVKLEGLVVLKIIKHCQENFPMTVMGQLLGMDMGDTLEITNCYPFLTQSANAAAAGPEASEAAAAFEANQQQYQRDMMFYVREGMSISAYRT
jgi:translation initiation factor 3 subunit H